MRNSTKGYSITVARALNETVSIPFHSFRALKVFQWKIPFPGITEESSIIAGFTLLLKLYGAVSNVKQCKAAQGSVKNLMLSLMKFHLEGVTVRMKWNFN